MLGWVTQFGGQGCLRECGLALCEQQKRNIRNHFRDERVEALIRLCEELLADVSESVYDCTQYNVTEDAADG